MSSYGHATAVYMAPSSFSRVLQAWVAGGCEYKWRDCNRHPGCEAFRKELNPNAVEGPRLAPNKGCGMELDGCHHPAERFVLYLVACGHHEGWFTGCRDRCSYAQNYLAHLRGFQTEEETHFVADHSLFCLYFFLISLLVQDILMAICKNLCLIFIIPSNQWDLMRVYVPHIYTVHMYLGRHVYKFMHVYDCNGFTALLIYFNHVGSWPSYTAVQSKVFCTSLLLHQKGYSGSKELLSVKKDCIWLLAIPFDSKLHFKGEFPVFSLQLGVIILLFSPAFNLVFQ